jgi:hypothetical protein
MKTVHGIYDGTQIKATEPFEARPDTRVLITILDEQGQLGPFEATVLEDVAGCLAHTGPAKTLEEMRAGVLRHAQAKWR